MVKIFSSINRIYKLWVMVFFLRSPSDAFHMSEFDGSIEVTFGQYTGYGQSAGQSRLNSGQHIAESLSVSGQMRDQHPCAFSQQLCVEVWHMCEVRTSHSAPSTCRYKLGPIFQLCWSASCSRDNILCGMNFFLYQTGTQTCRQEATDYPEILSGGRQFFLTL